MEQGRRLVRLGFRDLSYIATLPHQVRPPPAAPSMARTQRETTMSADAPDPSRLVAPDGVKPMKESRVKGLTVVNTIAAHNQPVASISLHPDGETFASVGDDGLIKLWCLPGSVANDGMAGSGRRGGGVGGRGRASYITSNQSLFLTQRTVGANCICPPRVDCRSQI